MRLLYGSPPSPGRGRDLLVIDKRLADIAASLQRQQGENELGKAMFNLIAPLCGEEPLP
jgi:hypothetical protein